MQKHVDSLLRVVEKTTSRSGSEAGGSHENEAKVSKVMEANDVDSENVAMVKYAFMHTYGNVTRNFTKLADSPCR